MGDQSTISRDAPDTPWSLEGYELGRYPARTDTLVDNKVKVLHRVL